MIVIAAVTFAVRHVEAVPFLQLDIAGGSYNTATETVVASSDQFSVIALVDTAAKKSQPWNAYPFYVSAAVIPNPGTTGDFGSFKINGISYRLADMVYGTPPEGDGSVNTGNLPAHGIFPTLFTELRFTNPTGRTSSYNVQTAPGTFAGQVENGTLAYESFNVDVSSLLSGYAVHFDLYTVAESTGEGHFTVQRSAPFSHDAESGAGDGFSFSTTGSSLVAQVPDRGPTVALLAGATFALVMVGRSARRKDAVR